MTEPLGATVDIERTYEEMLAGLMLAKILDESARSRIVSRFPGWSGILIRFRRWIAIARSPFCDRR